MKYPNQNEPYQQMNYSNEVKITALYCRLSKEEQQRGESLSIENQRKILLKFCSDNGFLNPKVFVDDGETGVFFDRPGLNEMLAEIRAGNVSTVVIKDQSRIGREVIEIGLLKRTFDEYNVRFMSAEDGLDTAKGFDIMSLLRDVFNEWYVADCSKKIRAVQKAKGTDKSGIPLASNPPYGYKKDPENPKRWLVDEPAAKVVRQIFQWCMEGLGITHISHRLREEKVEIPSIHAHKMGTRKCTQMFTDPYDWKFSTIEKLLERQEYLGHIVNFKTFTKSYKNRKKQINPPENHVIFENIHEPIVDSAVFEKVQQIRKSGKRRRNHSGRVSILSGLVYCVKCKSKLYLSCGEHLKPEEDNYVCSGFRKKKTDCDSSNYIRRVVLEQLVLEHLQKVTRYATEYESEFVLRLQEISESKLQKNLNIDKKTLIQTEKRIQELDQIIRFLYEDKTKGILTDERFVMLSQGYETEQRDLRSNLQALKVQIDKQQQERVGVNEFISRIRKYTEITELSTLLLNELVERIEVYPRDKANKDKIRKVDIYFNYVGLIEIKEEPLPKNPTFLLTEQMQSIKND
jgi:DNA invertase Pin-like site-specific DNA recombinase